MAENELLTVPESSAMLRLQPSTVRAWILAKRIPYVKLGGRVFLRRSDCEALIASSIVPAREGRNGH
jgi:excisionase family DNA binding protein